MRSVVVACATLALLGCAGPDIASPVRLPPNRSATIFPGSGVIPLGDLGGRYTQARAINSSAQVVGYSAVPGKNVLHAFRWEDGAMSDLGALPDTIPLGSGAISVNDVGQIVGWSDLNKSVGPRAVLWQDGKIYDLGVSRGPEGLSVANGINNAGQVVGITFGAPVYDVRAFLWEAGMMHDLGTLPGGARSEARAINGTGQVAGGSATASGEYHAVVWQSGVIQDLGTLGGRGAVATAINDAGQVVGNSSNSAGADRAFLWQDGQMQDLGTLPAPYNTVIRAVAINEAGQVLGYSRGPGSVDHAFLWSSTDGMEDLGALVGLRQPGGINGSSVVGELTPLAFEGSRSSLIRLRLHPPPP